MTVEPPLVALVEDDADIREDVTELLRDEGFEVVAARNGVEALDMLRSLESVGRPPCIVLLDLMMPIMDGWALRRAMIGDPQLRELPVLLVSGAQNVSDEATALAAAGYLVKPFEWRALIEAVRQHC